MRTFQTHLDVTFAVTLTVIIASIVFGSIHVTFASYKKKSSSVNNTEKLIKIQKIHTFGVGEFVVSGFSFVTLVSSNVFFASTFAISIASIVNGSLFITFTF